MSSRASWRNIVRASVNLRSMLVVYFLLLMTYIALYYAVPLYVMPHLDEIKRRDLLVLVRSIVGNASGELDKAFRIYVWENLSLTNI